MKRTAVLAVSCLVCALLCCARTVRAQQLEPRAYSLSPVGTNFLGMAYFYSSGGAVLDPSLPIENIQARVHTAVPFYGRTFGLFGRLASVSVSLRPLHTPCEGDVQEEHKSVDRTGFGDPAMQVVGEPDRRTRADPAGVSRVQARDHPRRKHHRHRALGPVRFGKIDQSRNQPLGLQAGAGAVPSRRTVGPRALRGGLAVHGQQ